MNRIAALQQCIKDHDAGALIMTFLPDIRWLTGFSGSNALIVFVQGEVHFITDGRYTTQSRDEVNEAHIHIASSSMVQCVLEVGILNGIQRVVFQAEHMTVARLEEYKEALPEISFVPASRVLDEAVAVKTGEEKARVSASQRITDSVFEYLVDFVKPGMTEQEVAAEIVYQHMRRGASSMSFDPIVASGPNSALPHARPTERKLVPGDMVVVDMGCFKEGYASDMTRTFAVGEPDAEASKVYQVVLDAQRKALDAASAQLTSQQLDGMARSVIKDAGYGSYFTHSLGHGVGLQIHEWPSISWKIDYPLLPGMIITIEPGIYIPDRFGVRIEDMVQLTETGCVNLTASPKQLISI